MTLERGANLTGRMTGEFLTRNWPYANNSLAFGGVAFLWNDVSRTWFSFGTNGANTLVQRSANGMNWVNSLATINNVHVNLGAAVKNSTDQNMLIGITPSAGSTNNKIYRSTNFGLNWNAIAIGPVDTSGILALTWSDHFGVFLAGGSSGGTTASVYTSTNGDSGNWNLQLGDASATRVSQIAVSENANTPTAVAISNTTFYWTSTSPTTTSWTLRTLPFSNPAHIIYSPFHKLFYMIGGTGAAQIFTSPDGINWTLVTPVTPFTAFTSLQIFGQILVGFHTAEPFVGIAISTDGGLNWSAVHSVPFLGPEPFFVAQQPGVDPHQLLLYENGSGFVYTSLAG